jgi:hypothetical protein
MKPFKRFPVFTPLYATRLKLGENEISDRVPTDQSFRSRLSGCIRQKVYAHSVLQVS